MSIRILILSLTMISQCFALQKYPLVDQQKTRIAISQKHATRIAIEEDRIQQIFGIDGQFNIEIDELNGQIFIHTTDSDSQKPVAVTIVTENGLTQDLKLVPRNISAQSVLFYSSTLATKPAERIQSRAEKISQLMKAMVRNKELISYDRMALTKTDRKFKSSYKLKPLQIYCGDKFNGRVYRLTNLSDKKISVNEYSLAKPGDVAISVEKSTLQDKECSLIYVISKRA